MSSKATREAIEAATAGAILRASHFTASIRANGSQTTHPLKTLTLAREAARLMPEAMGVQTRALVYAVTPEGRAYLVPEDFPNPAEGTEAMTTLSQMAAKIERPQSHIMATAKASNGVTLKATTPAPEAGKAAKDDDGIPAGLRRPPMTAAEKAALQARTKEELNKVPTVRTPASPPSAKPAAAPPAAKPASTPKPEAKKPEGKPSKESPTMTTKATKSKARTAVKAATTKPAKPGERSRYDWSGAEEKAAKGTIPTAPDFSAETHARFRPLLDEVVKAAKAGNAEALRKIKINPVSSSPKAVDRFRKLCLKALAAKKAA